MLKSNLDKRICDIELSAVNTQTYREFIRESEEEFEIAPADLDSMDEKQLENYVDFLDDLWLK